MMLPSLRSPMTPSLIARVAILLLLGACSSDGTGPSPGPEPAHTPPGTPTGPVVTALIGAAGGSLTSGDGVLTLTVPAGALSASTEIGIQPITSTSPGSFGGGFRLTPDGQTFAQPATLSFTYADSEIQGTVPALLGIARQQSDSSWLLQEPVTLDATTKTLTISTSQFTQSASKFTGSTSRFTGAGARGVGGLDFGRVWTLIMRPQLASVKVRESIPLEVSFCKGVYPHGASFMATCYPAKVADPGTWKVKGGAAFGTVSASEGGATFSAGATYTAPAKVPPQNPVQVTVLVRLRTEPDQTLLSEITVTDVCTDGGTPGVCTANWSGSASSIITDASPTYKITANVTWVYDPTSSVGQNASYYAEGSVSFVPLTLDPCTTITPSTMLFGKDDPNGGGGLSVDFAPATPTYSGGGATVWTATYADICNGGSVSAPAGGSWFQGQGSVTTDSAGKPLIKGPQNVGGQTYFYDFVPQVLPPPTARR